MAVNKTGCRTLSNIITQSKVGSKMLRNTEYEQHNLETVGPMIRSYTSHSLVRLGIWMSLFVSTGNGVGLRLVGSVSDWSSRCKFDQTYIYSLYPKPSINNIALPLLSISNRQHSQSRKVYLPVKTIHISL